jgi:hypothetical protein
MYQWSPLTSKYSLGQLNKVKDQTGFATEIPKTVNSKIAIIINKAVQTINNFKAVSTTKKANKKAAAKQKAAKVLSSA